jgi:hypothetical protein
MIGGPKMKTDEFRAWLQSLPMNPKPMKDCISRCRKVEAALSVDLDKEYRKDRGKAVISALTYTPEDERNHKVAPESFKFKPDANIRFRFTDLRSATKKYFSFCEVKAVKKNG